MGTANDKKVLELKAKIQEKRDKFEKVKFTSLTNCSLELDGVRNNILIMDKDFLTLLLIKLNSYRMSMVDLGVEELNIGGYAIQDWISDIQLKLKVIAQKSEEEKLKILEKKLGTLLSEDKKTELELTSIASLLD
jgi:hypothetical protein